MATVPVWLLGGGPSAERHISSHTVRFVAQSLAATEYRPHLLALGADGAVCRASSDVTGPMQPVEPIGLDYAGLLVRFEETLRNEVRWHGAGAVIVDLVMGIPGEDGRLQRVMERCGLMHTSGDASALEICCSKTRTKDHLKACGFVVPEGFSVDRDAWTAEAAAVTERVASFATRGALVKPDGSGSSLGVGRCDPADPASTLSSAFRFDTRVVVEQYVVGEEVTCGVFSDGTITRVFRPVRRGNTAHGILDFSAKYCGGRPRPGARRAKRRLDEEMVCDTVMRAFTALGDLRYCRIDGIVSDLDGQLYILEVNPIPFIHDTASFVTGMRSQGLTVAEFLRRLIAAAAGRRSPRAA